MYIFFSKGLIERTFFYYYCFGFFLALWTASHEETKNPSTFCGNTDTPLSSSLSGVPAAQQRFLMTITSKNVEPERDHLAYFGVPYLFADAILLSEKITLKLS